MASYHAQAIAMVRKGEWDAAHRLIQSYSDSMACLIHGYLHRVEGDLWNARYWYKRAGEPCLKTVSRRNSSGLMRVAASDQALCGERQGLA